VPRRAAEGEGPVLAILAMLARNSALRVAAGGSAPPIPFRCAPWLCHRQVGTGKQAWQSNWKAGALSCPSPFTWPKPIRQRLTF